MGKACGMRLRAVCLLALMATVSAGAADVQSLVGGITNPSADVRAEAWKAAGPVGAAGVAPVAEHLASNDPGVAKAAAAALDNIVDYATRPGAEAEKAAVAAELAKLLDPARPEPVRREAVVLLAMCGGDAEAPALGKLLAEDGRIADDARQSLQQMPGNGATQALLAGLPTAPPASQAGIASALARRGVKDAIPALKELAAKTDKGRVKWAAVNALARLGVAPSEAMPRESLERPAQLRRWDNARIDAARALAESGENDKAVALYAEAAQGSGEGHQVGTALIGLSKLAPETMVPLAMAALENSDARDTAVRLLAAANVPQLDQALADKYSAAQPATKVALLETLAARKAPTLDGVLQQAQQDPSPEVRLAAAQLGGGTPSADLLTEALAKASDTGRDRAADLALAQAQEIEASDAAAAQRLYETVARAKVAGGYRAQAFNGLERLGRPESLPFLDEYAAPLFNSAAQTSSEAQAFLKEADRDASLAIAAGRAYVAAHAAEGKDKSIPVLQGVLEASPAYDVSSLAAEKLAAFGVDPQGIARAKGFITNWQILGPFPSPDKAAFGQALIPETDEPLPQTAQAGDKTLQRQDVQTEGLPAVVDLRRVYRNAEDVAAYGYAEVPSDAAKPVVFLVGSDDGCELFLNGQRIHANNASRTLQPDADRVEASLRAGVNRLVIKVLQGGADWKFCVRLTDPQGNPIDLNK